MAVALSGCSELTASHPGPAAHAGPIPGVLRFAEGGEPASLNPLLSATTTIGDLNYLMFSYFFDVDDHDRLVPDLATEVPTVSNGGISEDGRTITYHLRHGVRWQDGAPLTASDVLFTFKAIMSPRNDVPSRTGYDQIENVEATDDYTIVVRMKRVFAPVVAYFMCEQGSIPVLPSHLLSRYPDLNRVAWNSAPIGSGPFKFAEWMHGDHITLDANPLYWRGRPRLHQIVPHHNGHQHKGDTARDARG